MPRDPETASLDGMTLNADRLCELFPEAFTEGRLDGEGLYCLHRPPAAPTDHVWNAGWFVW
jgi:hypothetical protein